MATISSVFSGAPGFHTRNLALNVPINYATFST
jgi:hypothetical protein